VYCRLPITNSKENSGQVTQEEHALLIANLPLVLNGFYEFRSFNMFSLFQYKHVVKPVLRGHLWDKVKVAL